jgi:hypothetical protein
MPVEVITVSTRELERDRERLLRELNMTESELRWRVISEVSTSHEREALERLKEIAFLLGEDQ